MPSKTSYLLEYKQEVVKCLSKLGIKETLKKYNIPKSTIYFWAARDKQGILNNEGNSQGNNLINKSRKLDPNIIVFIQRVKLQFPKIGRGKMKALCDRYSFINNVAEISLSSIGRVIGEL